MIFFLLQMVVVTGVADIGLTDDFAQVWSNPGSLVLLVIFGIVDFIILTLIGAFTRAMLIGMYKDVAKKGKTRTKDMIVYGKKYFKTYLGYIFVSTALFMIPLLLMAGIVLLYYQFSDIVAIVFGILFGVIYIIYAFLLGFGLFFIDPIIASERGKLFTLIKKAFAYVKSNLLHTIIAWALIMAVSMGVSIILSVIGMPINIIDSVGDVSGIPVMIIFTSILSIIFSLVQTVVNMCVGLIMGIFRFKTYYSTKK